MTYDPILLTKIVKREVVRGNKRKYFRFRKDRWYGGVATGDVVGCNLRCKFCWAWRFTWNTKTKGKFLSPNEAFLAMKKKASNKIRQLRVSGGEPTIGFEHLLQLVEISISENYHFIIETNGLVLGLDYFPAKQLGRFHNQGIEIRVSIKGASPKEFELLTGSSPKYWYEQLRALDHLVKSGLEVGTEAYPAVMLSFSTKKSIMYLKDKLEEIDPELPKHIDPEYVILYPHVEYILRAMNLKPRIAYRPDNIPRELI